LRYRETLLAEWDRLRWRDKLVLVWHSLGAFADALWLQSRRLEEEMFQDLRYGGLALRSERDRSSGLRWRGRAAGGGRVIGVLFAGA
jgi:hypothetical protein